MTERAELKSWQPSFKLYFGFYVLMLLMSIDGLYWAERAAKSHGWLLQLTIGVPFAFTLMAGLSVWVGRKRQKLDEQVAGSMLFFLAFVISSAYDGMRQLAAFIH